MHTGYGVIISLSLVFSRKGSVSKLSMKKSLCQISASLIEGHLILISQLVFVVLCIIEYSPLSKGPSIFVPLSMVLVKVLESNLDPFFLNKMILIRVCLKNPHSPKKHFRNLG